MNGAAFSYVNYVSLSVNSFPASLPLTLQQYSRFNLTTLEFLFENIGFAIQQDDECMFLNNPKV